MEVLLNILENLPELISAFVGVVSALVAFFMLIPGNQPEAFLQNVLEFIKKFSKK